MKKTRRAFHPMKNWTLAIASCIMGLMATTQTTSVEAAEGLGGPPHIGTFEGSTTFTTTSSNGIDPGLYLEVMDEYGNYTEYTSEDGVITITSTKEGAYITQAKLLGKTKYVDQDSGEVLDRWEDGRNLQLASSEGPGLTTTGKNLFDINESTDGYGFSTDQIINKDDWFISSYIRVEPNSSYMMSCDTTKGINGKRVHFYDKDKNLVTHGRFENDIILVPNNSDISYMRTNAPLTTKTSLQIEKGTVATAYEPYQSSLLNINENLELRGVGGARDTLDLITGEVTKQVGEIVLDGSEGWEEDASNIKENTHLFKFGSNEIATSFDQIADVICDTLPSYKTGVLVSGDFVGVSARRNGNQGFLVRHTSLNTSEFKQWLQDNPITMQYQLANKLNKTLALNSTYYFQPVLNREVRVDGIILPLVASVTIPTEPLTFIIDPNQAEGQQFVAPEFSLTNHTPASIFLNLKAFEQTTNVLNDVLPEAHDNWRRLNKAQSKDIALALVPQPSEGWLSLIEGPRYVADDSNYQLGEVDAESTVEFTFSALHGRAIIERLAPQYRLAFEFGF